VPVQKIKTAGIVDMGTTGLNPVRDEIIEICIILFSFNVETGEVIDIIDKYCGLQEPTVPISKRAHRILGLNKSSVRGMSLDDQRIKSLLKQAEIIIAHNAAFHSAFLINLFSEAAEKPWLCSMNGIDWKKKGFLSKSLHKLLKAHGIESPAKHRAKYNAMATLSFLNNGGSGNESYLLELINSKPINLEDTFEQEAAAFRDYNNIFNENACSKNFTPGKIGDQEEDEYITVKETDSEEIDKEKYSLVHEGICAAFATSSIFFILNRFYNIQLSEISYTVALCCYFGCLAIKKKKSGKKWYLHDLFLGFLASAAALAAASLVSGLLIFILNR